MMLPITSVVAAMLAILMLPLTLLVSTKRAMLGQRMGDIAGVAFGDADDLGLKRRIRAFGNFVEYVPYCVLMVALLELAGASATSVWLAGGALVAGRVVHAGGMLFSGSPVPRGIGMMFTYSSFVGPAVWLLVHYVG